MERTFTDRDILTAKEVHLYDGDTLYIVLSNDEIYGFHQGGNGWYRKENFWDYFESSMMLSFFSPITKEEAVKLYRSWNH